MISSVQRTNVPRKSRFLLHLPYTHANVREPLADSNSSTELPSYCEHFILPYLAHLTPRLIPGGMVNFVVRYFLALVLLPKSLLARVARPEYFLWDDIL